MAFKYDFLKASDPVRPLSSMIEQAEDLLFNLRFRREEPHQSQRPILFICHSFGGLILKHALLIAKRRADFRDIFDSIAGILFIACIHDEHMKDLERCLLWSATVELSLTKTRRHDVLESLNTPTEWEAAKQIMEHFKMLYLPFPVRTFCETKATVYLSRPFRGQKSQILCPEEAAFLPGFQETVKPIDLDHTQLSVFPNRTDPFYETLLLELHSLLDVHDGKDIKPEIYMESIVSSLKINSNSSQDFAEDSSKAPKSETKMNIRLPCHILAPHQPNHSFIGREDVLDDIEAHLRPVRKLNEGHCVFALCGLGGMGKTQIALKYAFSSLSKFEVVLWIPSDSREKMLARHIAFAVEIGLVESTNDDQNKAKDIVKEWFETSQIPYLIIFDNADSVDNKALLAEFWPGGDTGSILITSRDKSLLGEFSGQSLTQLLPEDAIELLMILTNRGGRKAAAIYPEREMQAAANLVEVVGCLPLAITQLASIAIEDCCSLRDLESSYDNFAQLIEDSEYGQTVTGTLSQYSYSLETVLSMNYENLDRPQQDLLNILSFLDPDKIQFDLLTGSVGDIAQQHHEVFKTRRQLIKARGFLLKSSLLYENAELSINWMHRLVQSTCQLRMLKTSPETRQKAFESAFSMVHKAFPVAPITGRHDRSYWAAQEGCLAHVQILAKTVESSQHKNPLEVDAAKFSKLLHDAAWYLYERGTFQPAYELLDVSEMIATQAEDRTGMLVILAEICRARASLQTETNQPQQAYESFTRELDFVYEAIEAGVMKRPHMQEVFSLGGVANALQGLHRYTEAEAYYRKALEAFEGMPGILSKMSILEHNFAICLWIQGRHEEAFELLNRIITDRNDTTTYRTAHAMFALGNVETRNNMLDAALATHVQTLKLFRATLGDGHHKTGNTLYKIGCHLRRKHDYSGSITNLRDALQVFESGGAFLNETARSTFMLGCVYQDAGEIANGRLLIEKAEEMRKKVVGDAEWSPASGVSEFDSLINCWSR
ncbi:tetratricopeptide repeat domain-containing protein, partial [Metarhizium brunneum ARSEF 3297]